MMGKFWKKWRLLQLLLHFFSRSLIRTPPNMEDKCLKYTISNLWNSGHPSDNAEINLKFYSNKSPSTCSLPAGLVIEIDAPFYNDPKPPASPVGSTDMLWDHEVVEVFFLSETERKYLETEFSPSGHYLLLELDTNRKVFKKDAEMPINYYKVRMDEANRRWHGTAVIPFEYLPKNVNKFNAYAIHKSDPDRVYMSLFPTPKGKYGEPNFHRLNYFRSIDLKQIL